MNIGIVGKGFVGSAIYEKFSEKYTVLSYDTNPELSDVSSLEELVKKSNLIFVCLPTPMIKNTGRCSTHLVNMTLKNINNFVYNNEYSRNKSSFVPKTVVIKSTVPPGTCDPWNQEYWLLDIVFSPEFLTEANAKEDFSNQTRIILGGPEGPRYGHYNKHLSGVTEVAEVFETVFGSQINIVKTDFKSAEMVKYMANAFLATKVAFANQMYELCDQMDLDYNTIKNMVTLDPRIGNTHLDVPGPDGDFGFGGHCFPKDLNALINLFIDNDLDPTLLKEVRSLNDRVRINKDWLLQKNRAVI